MPLNLDALAGSQRLLIEADLEPLQGTRFQPTGFPNLGAAKYKGFDEDGQSTDMLLVESAQSVANRLESACWNMAADDWIAPLQGVPVVKVKDAATDLPLTNSVLEAHRLNSVYIENSDWFADFSNEIFDPKRPVDMRGKVYPAILKYDPNALIHGFFLESIAGVIRSPRALSGFIEASQVQTASSGGVKNDRVSAKKGDKDEARGAAEGYGNVPFARDEYVSPRIIAYFNLDLAQIRGFGLGPEAEAFLIAFALLKIRRFLETGLRLRTACDLDLKGELRVKRPTGFAVPSLQELEGALPGLIGAVTGFASNPVTEVTWKPKKTPAKSADKTADSGDTGDAPQ